MSGSAVDRPVDDAEANVIGTIRVLEAARRHGAQVVFSSTGGAIYGECTEPAREDAALTPLSPYGASKLAREEYIRMYNRLHGTTHVCLRYGNVYGPRQDPHGEAGVVAIFLGALADGKQARIFGEGAQTRDYVYVGDVARATRVLARPGGRRVQHRHGSRGLGGRAVRAVSPGRGLEHRRRARCAARLGELQRSVLDPEPGRGRARLHADGRAGGRAAGDLGLDKREARLA